jgi:FlaA1/EpsC-like NDP-sugar epimerase
MNDASSARLLHFFDRLSRRKKQLVALVSDACVLPFALWCAVALRLGQWNPDVSAFGPAFAASVLISIPVFVRLGLYRQVIRYMGNDALIAVIKGVTITALGLAALAYMVPMAGFPRSVPVIFWLLAFVYVAGSRFAVRDYMLKRLQRLGEFKPVLIYGAGNSGAELSHVLRLSGDYDPQAFIDDHVQLHGRVVDGLRVYPPRDLSWLLASTEAREVLVAVPSTAVEERKRIIDTLEPYAVHVRLIPDLADLLSGRESMADARDVEVEDLLGRNPVDPFPELLADSVGDKVVMVTGAAGSIGSELCRQIAALNPRLLVLLDHNEFGLYEIYRELSGGANGNGANGNGTAEGGIDLSTPIVPLLGSVLDTTLLERAMAGYHVDTVFHAAAYKHVSLVESNVIQGIRNNTFGTLYAAQAAIAAAVSRFVLISTDKAVRTTNVMGATKRMAELVLQALQPTTDQTTFSIVRFGNVLGSSGSVVPLFQEQIGNGGPVTVTHPEATRFFMTIREAAQLVLQASALARGGDLFLLDMGEPVRIMDLARKLIRLQGYRVREPGDVDGDIEVAITGLKAGEKLHEELLIADAASGTEHPKIMRAEEAFLPWPELRAALATLEQACASFDFLAIKAFIERVVEGADLAEQLIDLTAPGGLRLASGDHR